MREIDAVMEEFMDRKALFTSIDIANEVKRRGTWILATAMSPFICGSMPGWHRAAVYS